MTLQQILYYCAEGDPAVTIFRSHAEVMAYVRKRRAEMNAAQPPALSLSKVPSAVNQE